MHIKRIIKTKPILLIMIFIMFFTQVSFAEDINLDSFSTNNQTNNIINSESYNVNFYENNIVKKGEFSPNYLGTFYSEYPVRYNPIKQFIKYDAFEIGRVTFDTTGEVKPSTITVSYNEGKEVTWTISGAAGSSAEFNVIKAKVTVDMKIEVSQQSSTTQCIGASITKEVPPNKYGYVAIYAHGVSACGSITYKWSDRTGKSGYIDRPINAYLPISKYDKFNIHFGPLTYQTKN